MTQDGHLGEFEGRDVIKQTVAVTNAGDGLSEAMKIEPQEMHLGDMVYVVMECEVAKVRFDPVKDTDALARVSILRAGTATIMEPSSVKEAIEAQRERNERARDAERGTPRLTDQELYSEHLLGAHSDGLVEGCVECEREAGAEHEEAAETEAEG